MLRKTDRYMALMTGCMLMLSACSSNDAASVADPEPQVKTPIELTVGITGENAAITRGVTRTVVTTDNPYGQSAQAFAAGTSLYMVMKSDDGASSGAPKYTRTIGYAQEVDQGNSSRTLVKFANTYLRYYEDSYSRNSKVSIYSVCVPGYRLSGTESVSSGTALTGTVDGTTWSIGNSTDFASNTWSTTEAATTIQWPLRGTSVGSQNATFINNQDLCFSNNVSNLGSENRISFNDVDKKFTGGHMIFYHALTKVTFKIKKGDGFPASGGFEFSNTNENIVLKGFNTEGTFTIKDGEFTTVQNTTITKLADTKTDADADYNYVLSCLMLPGSALTSTALDEVCFTIDNNLYHITKSQLAAALSGKKLTNNDNALGTGSVMRPGVHYIFTLTVGKKKMDKLTASVVPWEEVTADDTDPTNARIQVSLLKNGTQQTGAATFDLYRATYTHTGIDDNYVDFTNWNSGYAQTENKAWLTENSTNEGIYTAHDNSNEHTPWYWPDNKTFYHFRTVMPTSTTVSHDATNNYDYISIAYAQVDATKDICWGAPFVAKEGNVSLPNTSDKKLVYSTTSGFDNAQTPGTTQAYHQISKAIGPTKSDINMEMFHMLSEVTINLSTTTGDDKVDIDNATMELSNISKSGIVKMSNGLIVPSTTVETVSYTDTDAGSTPVPWHYYFVPQDLTDVVLTITTADHNQYIVDMKDVTTTLANIGNNLIANPYTETETGSGKYKIGRWYPNYKYNYTFKLTKSGISLITATLADWETVTAGDDNVQIK